MSNEPITVKLEKALQAYIMENFQGTGEPLEGVTIYRAHSTVKKTAPDHVMIHAARPGGDLAYMGNYEVPVNVTIRTSAFEQEGDAELPETRHELRVEALVGILSYAEMETVKTALNAPLSGEDLRAVVGLGISAFEGEPRDDIATETWLGTSLPFIFHAHLEDDAVTMDRTTVPGFDSIGRWRFDQE